MLAVISVGSLSVTVMILFQPHRPWPLIQLTLQRHRLRLQRKVLPRQDAFIGLEQIFDGNGLRTLVTHDAFVVTCIEIRAGTLSMPLPSGEVLLPARLVLFIPPRCVVPMHFADASVHSTGIAGFDSNRVDRLAFLPVDAAPSFADADAILRLQRSPGVCRLEPEGGVPFAIRKARALLHEGLGELRLIQKVARQAGMSTEALGRGFRAAYQLTPRAYCQKARIFHAVLKILSKRSIIESALEAGFADLKRFYVQFRKLHGGTPGAYEKARKRQDTGGTPSA